MAELAALNIKITGDATDLKAAVNTATGDLSRLGASAQTAGVKIQSIAPKFGAGAAAGGGFAQSMRGVSQQLSQVGQQTMATGNFVQALAIQLPDIGVAFGAVGAAAGLLAGIALPLLINAFSGASENAKALEEAMRSLADATAAFQMQAAAITLGIDIEEVLLVQRMNELLIERNRLMAEGATRGKLITLAEETAEIKKQLDAYRAAREEIGRLKSKTEEIQGTISGVTGKIDDAKDAMVALVNAAPGGNWLDNAIANAATMASTLWSAAQAMAELSQPGAMLGGATGGVSQGASGKGTIYLPKQEGAGGGGGSGGGGGGVNPIVGDLEALQNSLMTQEQIQMDSFTRQQETLQAALDQRLITQQEYAALMEASQRQHSDAMGAIDAYRYGDGLQKAGAFFGSMAEAMASGNDKMMKIGRAFGAAEALINAWRAYAQTLATPGLSPLAKFAAAAKVLGAGLGAVNAIKSGGKGGAGIGGGGAVAAAAGATTTEMRTANINFYGGFQPTQDTISMIANGLNDWLGDGGRLNVRQA